MRRSIVTGAAGFIGSHLVDRLIARGEHVIGVDNFIRGRRENLGKAESTGQFDFVELDLSDSSAIERELGSVVSGNPVDSVWHFAANSDIAAGTEDPGIDLRDTFMTTFNVLNFMRRHSIGKIGFASSSAIYGVLPGKILETAGPLLPISNYGAMKLAGEACISAAVESFLGTASIFRFPNVVGRRSTHGVIFDLMHKHKKNPFNLEVLGDGTQCKPYLHVDMLLDAVLFIWDRSDAAVSYYNIGPNDGGATVRFIADEVLKAVGSSAALHFTGGRRGWVGDVPQFQYSTEKLVNLGWDRNLRSEDAIVKACEEIALELGMAPAF